MGEESVSKIEDTIIEKKYGLLFLTEMKEKMEMNSKLPSSLIIGEGTKCTADIRVRGSANFEMFVRQYNFKCKVTIFRF